MRFPRQVAAGVVVGGFPELGKCTPTDVVGDLAFDLRPQGERPAVMIFLSCFVAGYTGLLLVPDQTTWLWVVLVGLGPGTFPMALVMINLRTRTHVGAGALSGFGQGVGYALACSGPLLFGILEAATGSWLASFAFLGGTLILLGIGSFIACRPVMLEDGPGVTWR